MNILLEDVYTHTSDCPLVFLDTRVLMHKLLKYYSDVHMKVDKAMLSNWAKASWSLLINDPLPYLPTPKDGYRLIMGDDYKYATSKYWRNEYYEPYKANRSADSDRPMSHNWIIEQLHEYLAESNISLIKSEGYECDDIAGGFARLKQESNRALFLVTVDSDWLQLVDNSKSILFANVLYHTPRLRSEAEALAWAFGKGMSTISHVSEIAKYKQMYGDCADNIAPGEAPLGIISLLEPTIGLPDDIMKEIQEQLQNKCSNTNIKHVESSTNWLTANNLPIIGR